MLRHRVVHLLLFSSLFCPAALRATIAAYTDQAAYLAAAAPQSTFGFTGGDVDYSTAAGLTVDGVNFVGTQEGIPGYYYLFTGLNYLYDNTTDLVGSFASFVPSAA